MVAEWNRSSLESLSDNAVPETQGVEYKQQPPSKDSADVLKQREEFLKDVTGMANAGGGVILYGVTNEGKLSPLKDEKPENYDQLSRRLEQWIDNGIEPRPHGVRFEKIDIDDDYILLLRIPNTMAGPFWAKVPGQQGAADTGRRIFKIRRGTRVIDMSYHEVREAFDRNSNALVHARNWVHERVQQYHRFGVATPLLHIIPLASYQRATDPLAVADIRAHELIFAPLFEGTSPIGRHNFDGIRLSSSDQWGDAFVQIFRNGSLEISEQIVSSNEDFKAHGGSEYHLHETNLADFVVKSLQFGLKYSHALGPQSSTMVCVSLVQASMAALVQNHRPKSTDRSMLEVPPFIVESGPSMEEVDRVAKASLDMLLQGYGFARCVLFTPEGRWHARR